MLQQMRASAKWIWIIVAVTFVGGFLLLESSGLMGAGAITPSTPVATVNGRDILYTTWAQYSQQLAQQRSEQIGRALTLDEQRAIENEAFEKLVGDVLLEQEYRRRGITVSAAEIRQAAQYYPPPELRTNPDLQTEGQFDPEKYLRLLSSPTARQGGLLAQLEAYYRDEIPKQKLFRQVAEGTYITDARLWRIWQDERDSAQVSFVVFRPTGPDSAVAVSDEEIERYYREHREQLERSGRAVVSVLTIPRVVSAADSAATLARIRALREEIVGGSSTFADVARRESADSVSAVEGGLLPPGPRGRFVDEFERAANALSAGEISGPVRTEYGYHLIELESRKGDTLSLRHILLPFQQSDSSATVTDRLADRLDQLAASTTGEPARFDSAAREMDLVAEQLVAVEGQPLRTATGRYIPSVSAWAFGGVEPGETSELFAADDGYYLARLDSITPGGVPPLEAVRADIRDYLALQKQLAGLVPQAQQLAQAAATSSLEEAARARGLEVAKSPTFNRVGFVQGLGQLNKAVGAAFGLPVGTVSAPIETQDGVYVLRVDRRVEADRTAFEAQKQQQRQFIESRLRQQKVQEFLENLRQAADVEDNRRELNAVARQATTG